MRIDPALHGHMALLGGDLDRWIPIGLGILALLALHHFARSRGQPGRYRWQKRPSQSAPRPRVVHAAANASAQTEPEFDSTAQMKAIASFEFETQPLLNKSETPLLYLLENVANDVGGDFRVMAQTSLGEIIRPKPTRDATGDIARAYRAINSKRLDFAVFNKFGKLVLGVEYQGHGHYRQTAFMRDAIKREVLRRARVPLLEVAAKYEPTKIAAEVREILSAHRALLRTDEEPAPRRNPADRRATA